MNVLSGEGTLLCGHLSVISCLLTHSFSLLSKIWFTLNSICSDLLPLPTFLQAILGGFLNDFSQAVKDCAGQIVDAAVEIYNRLSVDLLPTPAKSHYVFNLRDLSKCVQGEAFETNWSRRDGPNLMVCLHRM